jgi:GntR family transcriptional regulator / MocR family aminotransferase
MDTNFPADLLIELDRSRPRGLRVQLERGLRQSITSGSLPPGTALPPSRVLASELRVSRSLVVEAYEQLTAEGYLEAHRGSGTRVRRNGAGPAASTGGMNAAAADAAEPVAARPAVTELSTGTTASGALYWPLPPGSAGLPMPGTGLPDPALFPRAEWLRHYRDVLREIPDNGLLYPPPRGEFALRAALAAYLGRVRGVRGTHDQVVICAGFSQGLALLCGALARRGVRRIAVEDPCFFPHRLIIEAAGLRAVPVPVSRDGLEVGRLAGLGDVGAVLLSPAHSYPSGVVLSASRRAALLDWARETGGLVIEDDYDAELRYDQTPIGAMQGLDPQRVVYGGTVSKVLSPALRLGWLVVPPDLAGDVILAKAIADTGSESLGQLTLARFIDGGGLARHLRRVRPIYRTRRDALLGALRRHLPEIPVTGEVAGLHLLLRMPAGWDPGTVAEASARYDLQLDDKTWYQAGPDASPALLIGYGVTREGTLTRGIEALGSLIRKPAKDGLARSPSGS